MTHPRESCTNYIKTKNIDDDITKKKMKIELYIIENKKLKLKS